MHHNPSLELQQVATKETVWCSELLSRDSEGVTSSRSRRGRSDSSDPAIARRFLSPPEIPLLSSPVTSPETAPPMRLSATQRNPTASIAASTLLAMVLSGPLACRRALQNRVYIHGCLLWVYENRNCPCEEKQQEPCLPLCLPRNRDPSQYIWLPSEIEGNCKSKRDDTEFCDVVLSLEVTGC